MNLARLGAVRGKLKISLAHFPTFSDKSVPLGIACVNGALRSAGHDVRVYDFDFGLSVDIPDLYYRVHQYAWQGDPHVVNFLGGTDVDLVLNSVFFDADWFSQLARRDPQKHHDLSRILAFIDDAADRIVADEPEEVWCSTYVSNLWLSMLAARAIRKRRPNVKLGFGGPAVFTEAIRRFLLLNGIVDHCFIGEAEYTAMDYAAAGVPVAGMATCVDGAVVYRPRPLVKKLDDLPDPDFTGFPFPGRDIRDYLGREFDGIPVFFSRGCVQRCAFCAERNIWQRFRVKTPEAIVEELTYYQQAYGVSLFYNCDSLINFTESWLEELCDRIIAAELDCSFAFAFAIGKRLPASLAEKMARAGFTRIFIGAEHTSQPMLDRMNKGTVAEEVIQVASDAVVAGMSVQLGTIVNFPGETIDDILEEIRVFKQIDDVLLARGVQADQLPRRCLANQFRLDPGTPMLNAPETYGLTLSPIANPLSDELPGLADVLVRWDYAEPQDAEFHHYLASRFGNLPERWAVPEHLLMRMAQSLRDFIRDDDAFAFPPGVQLSRDAQEKPALRVRQRVLPLTPIVHAVLREVAGGAPLREVLEALNGRYRVRMAMLRKLVAMFYLEHALVFRTITPLSAEPAPRRSRKLEITHQPLLPDQAATPPDSGRGAPGRDLVAAGPVNAGRTTEHAHHNHGRESA